MKFLLMALWCGVVPAVSLSFAQSLLPDPVNGATLFQRIRQLRLKLQPDNSEENGFLYMINTPNNLHLHLQFYQMMPRDADDTAIHLWALPSDVSAHPEMLGKPSPFPQMWVRYHGDDFVEAGASHIEYPANFKIDANAHPNLVYDFAHKTVNLPDDAK